MPARHDARHESGFERPPWRGALRPQRDAFQHSPDHQADRIGALTDVLRVRGAVHLRRPFCRSDDLGSSIVDGGRALDCLRAGTCRFEQASGEVQRHEPWCPVIHVRGLLPRGCVGDRGRARRSWSSPALELERLITPERHEFPLRR